jgi:uncharacterized membrane protein YgaE (UPF0421/DUF939 family)
MIMKVIISNMVSVIVGALVGITVAFSRIKYAKKLDKIKAVLEKAETALNEETRKLAADIKAKL